MDVNNLMTFILLTPVLAAAVILLFLRDRGNLAAALSVSAAGFALGLAALLLANPPVEGVRFSVTWMELGDFEFSLGFLYNPDTAILLFVVTFVGFLIHVFSLGYMRDDAAKGRFFGGLSIFMFSMLGIVLSDNLAMIFVFWELVGFSSYMLIAHYLDTDEASEASKKAFVVNRVGDFGFLLGIVWAYWQFGTLNLADMEWAASMDPALVKAGIGLLLICGFLGKSAQFPLHVWLPDAMAGPTPVSALIHAATMVAAGIFLLVRIDFLLTPGVLEFIAWTGAGMGMMAGFVALGQNDIKKILAYSTLSQLGYMAAAFGIGMPGLALFHLTTHAFFKALLFLGAGSVIHACHHEQDIYRMGGLLRRMPVTAIAFICGVLALMGVNFTSGYWSKEAILTASNTLNGGVFLLLYAGALLTALYMGRLFFIAFLGSPRGHEASHARENGLVMTVPLVVLAVFALAGGFPSLWPEGLGASFLGEVDEVYHGEAFHHSHKLLLILGTAAWIVGLALAFVLYRPGSGRDWLEKKVPLAFATLRDRLFIDDAYNFYVTHIQQRFADILGFLDLFLISGLAVRGSAGLAGLFGIFARGLHTGNLHGYVYWFLGGVVLFVAFLRGWF